MSSRLILHIGANKTGSSAVQSFLRLNVKSLRSLGYRVPDRELGLSDKVTGEQVFAMQGLFNRGDRAGLVVKIKLLMQAAERSVIISAENLSNGQNFQFFNQALDGIDCKVILYIRRQDELLTSSWQQWNSKREVDFNGWLILALQRIGHWQRCIDGWESVVGAGNVTVRPYQRSDLVNADVVDDFVCLLGLPEPVHEFVKPPSLVNPSYTDAITPLVSGSKFLFDGEHDNRFYEMVADLTGEAFVTQQKVSLLSRVQREKLIEFYRPQNEAICRKYFPGRARLFEAVDHSKYDYLTPDELTKRQMEFLASLIFGLYKKTKPDE
jgi:hypothetical protein